MTRLVDVQEHTGLEDYEAQAHLAPAVQALRSEAATLVPGLKGRRVVMLNSTAQGGGVAEMLPKMVHLLRELGVRTDWAVMTTDQPEFFALTKRLHNLIHGSGRPGLTKDDELLYRSVSREAADSLKSRLRPGDVLVVHDPQPAGIGALLKKELDLPAIWRCHIGLDHRDAGATAAWEFLRPHVSTFDHCVFTAPEYIPEFLAGGRSSIITPGLDPVSHKNRPLQTVKLMGILCNAGLAPAHQPVLHPDWERPARRLMQDGRFARATDGGDIGFAYRPIIAQISRWDRLKGWRPLLEGFRRLKEGCPRVRDDEHRRSLEICRLVLAGPEAESIQDDPEAVEVLEELIADYRALPRAVQEDVALLSLPMSSRKHNALMVNVIQRCASVVVQNSLREGFGLTATEAMWKRAAVLGTNACGLRLQIHDGLDGRLVGDPGDPDEIAEKLDGMLSSARDRELWGMRAQRSVYEKFLIFTQLRRWLQVLADTATRA